MSGTHPSDDYRLAARFPGKRIPAPDLPYRPRGPERWRPVIALIGCGGISETHLEAYREAGYRVAALCDLDAERATLRRRRFYPESAVYTDYRELLARQDVEVVDIATHPAERAEIIRASILAGKHVLSQKPFVTDLDLGEELAGLAETHGVRLAVNQNGRWAPHLSYMREAVRAGLIGELLSVHTSIHWDHTWTIGTPFEEVDDLILFDFGIHWFDFLATLIGDRPIHRVQASRSHARGQKARPPMLAQAMVEFDGGQASLVFDGHLAFGPEDRTYVGGSAGSIASAGPDLSTQTVTLATRRGVAVPKLEGRWFPDGFRGSMAELLLAVEEGREPTNSARNNLKSLALCFSAIAAARAGAAQVPGDVRRLPE